MQQSNYTFSHIAFGKVCGVIYLLAIIGTAAIAAIAKMDAGSFQSMPSEIAAALLWIRERAWWLVLLLTATAPTAKIVQERITSRWIWSTSQSLLDKIQQEFFGALDGDIHHHRATLFKFVQHKWWIRPNRGPFWWPWGKGCGPNSGWLRPIQRSGHTTQKSNALFLAPDDADRAEGVAGKTWTTRNELNVSGLVFPVLGDEKTITEYSKQTWVETEWLKSQLQQNKSMALSFKAIPIEVNNRRWGVLLLDSRNPNAFQKSKVNLNVFAYVFGKLLERG